MSTLSYFQTINQTKNEEKNFNFSYLNLTTKKTNNTIKFEKKQLQKKQIKIIELRGNEHFGDVLMILNEKSPVTIKVKSKKAEFIFLLLNNKQFIIINYKMNKDSNVIYSNIFTKNRCNWNF